MSRFLIISSDCHAGLPTAEYRDYLDPAFRGQGLGRRLYDDLLPRLRVDGISVASQSFGRWQASSARV